LSRGEEIKKKWDLIPEGIDVLITHGPPHKILDYTRDGVYAGCEELLLAIERVKPKIHAFGHIHEGRGELIRNGTHFINACNCNLMYKATNRPIEVLFKVKAQGSSTALAVGV
jgi:Icc-related predicted phosphoesterase